MRNIYKYIRKGKLTIFLCLALLSCLFPMHAAAADGDDMLSRIVDFDHIGLYYAGADGNQVGEEIQNYALIEKGKQLMLRYAYNITGKQIQKIHADTKYYLDVSPHLVLSHLESGSPLTIETNEGSGPVQFGMIYADGTRAWVTFDAKADGPGTILSEYDELDKAYFYLNCGRADTVPQGEQPIEGKSNLYAMKFENGKKLLFGYAENEPIEAKAQIQKGGSLADKTITWSIDYTPWQNPSAADGVSMDTPFELRDTIDTALHTYVNDSAKIDGGGTVVTEYTSRSKITGSEEAYVIAETSGDGSSTVLTFGGTKLKAGAATQGNPAQPLRITYETAVNEKLLLPGSGGGKEVRNKVELFAETDGTYHTMNISSSQTVKVPQPAWLTKTGKTTRHTDGTGSVTDWTVTFLPNGFTFGEDNSLTLHDQLPDGSTLVSNSMKVDGKTVSEEAGENNSFTIPKIQTDNKPVVITYQTHVPEEMYDTGTSLGNNKAWFTFQYGGEEYTTPSVATPVGSGDGSGTPGTAPLVKSNGGYNASTRTIRWTVTINPHKAYLKSGTFTDDLKKTAGSGCGLDGHGQGLEVTGGKGGITVLVNDAAPDPSDNALINLEYRDQAITVKVGKIGPKTITLQYDTKICDPCIFANNTGKKRFTNTISTEDMILGKNSGENDKRSASADSPVDVSASVLKKNPPVYDYASGKMKWTVEVDAAGLPMAGVVLKDSLPAGLTYADGSFTTVPEITGTWVDTAETPAGQELTINLGNVTQKTTVSFDTAVDPEKTGFCSNDGAVRVTNTISMKGKADGVEFAEVSHQVQQSFANHGLVKTSSVDNPQELIRYDVLVNPFGLALPEAPCLVDTLDKRLLLDPDTLMFYEAKLTGTTGNAGGKPGYTKVGDGQRLEVTDYDPAANSFTVRLPIEKDSRKAYVLAYTADIMELQAGGYGNSVRFDGGSVLLGGNKNNSASVGGGGGGGGVAARKAVIAITKTDRDNQEPLAGVTFTLYQWDDAAHARGIPYAQGTTDSQGKLSFKVKPGASYELEETESISGYGSTFGWVQLPEGAAETDRGLLIRAGEAKTELKLELTNEAYTTDLVFCLLNQSGIPMAGMPVQLFTSDPGMGDPSPAAEVVVSPDGQVRFRGIRRGASYFIRRPDGGVMTVEVPADVGEAPRAKLPDGTETELDEHARITGTVPSDRQWALTVTKVAGGGTTPLAGAVFGLYAEEGCRTLLKTAASGTDGILRFEGLMAGQQYWLKETAAPAGYRLDPAVYAANEANPALTIANSAEEPGDSGEPGKPGGSGGTDEPGEPGGSGGTDEPGEPGGSGGSGDSWKPGGSGGTDEPWKPGGSGGTDEPWKPGGSGGSGDSWKPGGSGGVGDSGEPGGSGRPGDSWNPENPGGAFGNGNPWNTPGEESALHPEGQGSQVPAKNLGSPPTGDPVSWPAAVVFLMGILLSAVTLYCNLTGKRC